MSLTLALLLALSSQFSISGAEAGSYPAGWEGLSQFRAATLSEVMSGEAKIVTLYYLEAGTRKAVKYDLTTRRVERGDTALPGSFICLIENPTQGLGVSACDSRNGERSVGEMEVESYRLFADHLAASEIDASKVVRDGRNKGLSADQLSFPLFPMDDLLRAQRIGEGDFVAQCSSLQLTSLDGAGAVVLYETRRRPQFLGLLFDNDPQTKVLTAIHLKLGWFGKYTCDGVATLSSGKVLFASGKKLIALDYSRRVYAIEPLPAPPDGYVLFRERQE
ncbi:MAG TPA: hypothetical protein VHA35_20665 [Dongiaceae bacterium]|nr:hypothetical protein [Dongiaceae bacterium]